METSSIRTASIDAPAPAQGAAGRHLLQVTLLHPVQGSEPLADSVDELPGVNAACSQHWPASLLCDAYVQQVHRSER